MSCNADHTSSSQCSFGESSTPLASTNALLSTLLVSVLGNVGILFFLFTDVKGSTLKTMVGFAVGGLLGDVFLHLIPHASKGKSPHDVSGGLWILAGVLAFFFVEKGVRNWTREEEGGHSHGGVKEKGKGGNMDGNNALVGEKVHLGKKGGIRPGAVLNLFADATHNFVDGMAIAAAYQSSNQLGMSTTMAILLHEIPHEMGDFAVLLTQGFTKRGAFFAQFGSAIGAFAGCLFGIFITSSDSEPVAVLNFTAGGFIYVALVNVLPELLHEKSSMMQTLREALALGLGIAVMVFVAKHEESSHAGHAHHGHDHHDHGHAHGH